MSLLSFSIIESRVPYVHDGRVHGIVHVVARLVSAQGGRAGRQDHGDLSSDGGSYPKGA